MADFSVEGIIEIDASRAMRTITRFEKKLDGLYTKLEMVGKEIDSISRKDIDVKVKIDRDSLDSIRDSLGDEDIDIRANDDGVTRTIEEIQAELDRISREGIDIHGNNDTRATIDEIRAELARLGVGRNSVDIHASTRHALEEVERLKAEIDRMHADIKVKADRSELDKLKESADGAHGAIGGGGGAGGGLIGAILLLASTAGPLGAALAGPAAGALASFSVLGVGLGSYAAFAIPTFKKIGAAVTALNTDTSKLSPAKLKEYNKNLADMKKNTPALYEAAKGTQAVVEQYKEFSKQLQPELMKTFAAGVTTANLLLGEMGPIALAVAPAVTGLVQDMNKGIKTDNWQKFFDYVKNNAGSFVTIWGHVFGNLLTGFANLVVAFDPLTKMFNGGLLKMSQNFEKWSEGVGNSPGFKKFVAYVQTEGPVVLDVIGKIIMAIVNLVIALAPLGGKVVEDIGKLADGISNLSKSNPGLISLVGGIAGIGLLLSPLIGPLTGFIGLLTSLGPILDAVGWAAGLLATPFVAIGGMVGDLAVSFGAWLLNITGLMGPLSGLLGVLGVAAGPIGWIVLAFIGIGAALALTNKNTSSAKGLWKSLGDVWTSIKDVAGNIWDNIKKLYGVLKDSGAIDQFQQAFGHLAEAFSKLLPILKPMAIILGGTLVLGLIAFAYALNFAAKGIELLMVPVGWVIGKIVDLFQWLFDVIVGHSIVPDLIKAVIMWFAMLPVKLVELMVSMVTSVIQWFANLASSAIAKVIELKNKITEGFQVLKAAVGAVVSSMVSAVVGFFVNLGVKTIAKVLDIKASISAAFTAIKSFVTEKVGSMVSTALAKIGDFIGGIKSKMGAAKDAVTRAFANAGGWLAGAGEKLIRGLADGIMSGIHYVTGAIGKVTSKIAGFFHGSPVKWGPLTKFNDGTPGAKLVQSLAYGINNDDSAIRAMRTLTQNLAVPTINSGAAINAAWSGASTSSDPIASGGNSIRGGGNSGNTYQINVTVPVGGSSAEIGKTIVDHIDEYESASGKRRKKK